MHKAAKDYCRGGNLSNQFPKIFKHGTIKRSHLFETTSYAHPEYCIRCRIFLKKNQQRPRLRKRKKPIGNPKYTWSIQKKPRGRYKNGEKKQKPTSPHLHSNQNKISRKVGGPSTIQVLVQDHKFEKKKKKRKSSIHVPKVSHYVIIFLSVETVQNMESGCIICRIIPGCPC